MFELCLDFSPDPDPVSGSGSWDLEWFGFDSLFDAAATDALDTDFHRLGAATWLLNANSLQVGSELSACDTGFLGTNTAQVLRFTASLN